MDPRDIEIPEPLPEYWAQALLKWGKEYEWRSMIAWLPSELRIELYRRIFSCHPAKIRLRDDGDLISLIIHDTHAIMAIDFSKAGIRKEANALCTFVDCLARFQSPPDILIDRIELEAYEDDDDFQIISFGLNVEEHRWTLNEVQLCIEVLEAINEMVRMAGN